MQLHFQKMLGAGNKILIVDQRAADPITPDENILDALREASSSEGFDQLMWLHRAQDPEAEAAYRVFNYDGSEVEQCGNGARCVSVLLASQNPGLQEFSLESPAGRLQARVSNLERAYVDMGAPEFDDAVTRLSVNGSEIDVGIVSMGNPHCVLEVADLQVADVAGLGPAIESHELFPNRSNVGFMQVVDRANIKLRVFERGVGETLACGTGACAAVALGIRRGQLDEDVAVHLPGGQLVVSWRGMDASIWLSGDVEFISEGTIDL
ncbi:MAG: diaminopimelate epimerase [Woeseiaceae bacterium]